ncbi:MAG: cupredoxin domain-containing protein [Actinomycetota bacterium]
MRKIRLITLAVLVAAVGAWIGVAATASSASMTAHVRITENKSTSKYLFKPGTITVHKGDKVIWNNKSDAPHTVTFGSSGPTVQPGHSTSKVFKKTGTFKYHCEIHTYMHGKVVVQ